MRRILISINILIALIVAISFNVSPVSAHQTEPASFNCWYVGGGSKCYSYAQWGNGTQYPVKGASVQFTVSSPTISATNGFWDRFIWLYTAYDGAQVLVGLEKTEAYGSAGYCYKPAGLYLVVDAVDSNGQPLNGGVQCYSVPSDDVNYTVVITLSYYISNGGGMKVDVETYHHDTTCSTYTTGVCAIPGADQTYDSIALWENIDDTVSGHEVWGSQWFNNKYEGTDSKFHYQTSACKGSNGGCVTSVSPGAPNAPPQMYWHIFPQNSSTGGDLYSCVYESGATCTPGS